MVTPVARREAVAHLQRTHEVSQRRACRTIGADRGSIRYRSRRPDDSAIRARLRELAASRRRFVTGAYTFCSVGKAPPSQRDWPGLPKECLRGGFWRIGVNESAKITRFPGADERFTAAGLDRSS